MPLCDPGRVLSSSLLWAPTQVTGGGAGEIAAEDTRWTQGPTCPAPPRAGTQGAGPDWVRACRPGLQAQPGLCTCPSPTPTPKGFLEGSVFRYLGLRGLSLWEHTGLPTPSSAMGSAHPAHPGGSTGSADPAQPGPGAAVICSIATSRVISCHPGWARWTQTSEKRPRVGPSCLSTTGDQSWGSAPPRL